VSGKKKKKQGKELNLKRVEVPPGHVVFSFKYLSGDEDPFGFVHADKAWLQRLIERLREYSRLTREDLENPANKTAYRSHEIDWAKTARPGGFGIPKEAEIVSKPWQLGLGTSSGRFQGFFIGDTFHIALLDPKHKLYPGA
jgi:hypothetical protein